MNEVICMHAKRTIHRCTKHIIIKHQSYDIRQRNFRFHLLFFVNECVKCLLKFKLILTHSDVWKGSMRYELNDNVFSVIIKYHFDKRIQFESVYWFGTRTQAGRQSDRPISTPQLDIPWFVFPVCVLFYLFEKSSKNYIPRINSSRSTSGTNKMNEWMERITHSKKLDPMNF